jgi:membrane protease YdiL (CAAX protease family)
VASWRWVAHLLVLSLYPLLAFFGGLAKAKPAGPRLPGTVGGLLFVGGVQMALFLVLLGVAWLFSRFSRADAGLARPLRWPALAQGFVYSLVLRLGFVVFVRLIAGAFLMVGVSSHDVSRFLKDQAPETGNLVPHAALHNPLYALVLFTFLSFAVAGLVEELWRATTMSALYRLLGHWDPRARAVGAIVLSSLVFGLGHWSYGPGAAVGTALIGGFLACVIWRHRSVWPAIMAHGFFDACSFWFLLNTVRPGH